MVKPTSGAAGCGHVVTSPLPVVCPHRPMQREGETARPGRFVNPSGGADVTDVRTFILSDAWAWGAEGESIPSRL